jgi:hypothetical protein
MVMARSLRQWIALKRRRKAARRKAETVLVYIAQKFVEIYGEVPKDFPEKALMILYLSDVETYGRTGHPLLPGCRWVAGRERPELVID